MLSPGYMNQLFKGNARTRELVAGHVWGLVSESTNNGTSGQCFRPLLSSLASIAAGAKSEARRATVSFIGDWFVVHRVQQVSAKPVQENEEPL